ncbi:MAG: hydantoinase/oxoprolinase family protein [Candidatus Methanomethylophilaceae archaeon]|jgi:N-methylhydantoinase A/oxoprolinase/acetone carboxylase beta subunit
MAYGLGIDTGGTYTDAVVMNLETGDVLQSNKSPTTYDNLAIGIKNSISGLSDEMLSEVGVVALSSTLATNSVVEGRGCRVGLISMGHEYGGKYRADKEIEVSGAHDLLGRTTEPLDTEAVEEFLKSIKGKVEGVAISGYLAVRNPEHELIVRDMAYDILGVRAVCGHQLSSTLGFDDRTTTCIMNARLIPVIGELIEAMKEVIRERNIRAPLMVVKGDGSMMGESEASLRPIETILSGPASSIVGAKKMARCEDAIVVDIGGTTTDIGILRKGVPDLVEYGAVLGGMRTHVKAADITTAGLGGDSHILILRSGVRVSSVRSVPLCFAAERWPEITETLRRISEKKAAFLYEYPDDQKCYQETDFFIPLKKRYEAELDEAEARFMNFIKDGPRTLGQAASAMNLHPLQFNTSRLERIGYIQKIGLTPTDILHAEGSYLQFDPEPAHLALRHFSENLGISEDKIMATAKEAVIKKMTSEIVCKLLSDDMGVCDFGSSGKELFEGAVSKTPARDYSCTITLSKPIIGIGAPSGAYLPAVAERLGTELIMPKYSEVGNAVGAVTGGVIEREEFLVKPNANNVAGNIASTVFSRIGRFPADTFTEGIDFAIERGKKHVYEQAVKAGAVDIVTDYEVKVNKYPSKTNPDYVYYVDAVITVTAAGKPKTFTQ